MNHTRRFLRPLALCAAAVMSTSCSLVILRSGATNLCQYNDPGKTFTRAEVLKHLSPPSSSETFAKPRPLGSLAHKYPTLSLPVHGNIEPPATPVAIVDTYHLHGYILDCREYSAAGESSVFTLGALEVLNTPLAAMDRMTSAGNEHTFRVAYGSTGNMVVHRLDEVKVSPRRKAEPVSVW